LILPIVAKRSGSTRTRLPRMAIWGQGWRRLGATRRPSASLKPASAGVRIVFPGRQLLAAALKR
jgi:hypothetical protein